MAQKKKCSYIVNFEGTHGAIQNNQRRLVLQPPEMKDLLKKYSIEETKKE